MQTIKLTIAYDGTLYHGWQIQPNGLTIQECLESALSQILQEKVSIYGSGRTDTGVHAEGQVAHFRTEKKPKLENLLKSINALLPKDIRILFIEHAPDDFHARFSVKEKTYRYRITTREIQTPFDRKYALHHPHKLNLTEIKETLPLFTGTKNFKAFANESTPNHKERNPIKTIKEIAFKEEADGFSLTFRGDGFLYKMVRNIVGTLLDIGTGKLSKDSLEAIFASESRSSAGRVAPAHGLSLIHVRYE